MNDDEKAALVGKWANARKEAAAATATENALRRLVADVVFDLGEGELREGTEHRPLPKGWKVSMVSKINHSFESVDACRAALEAIEALGPVEEAEAARMVKWKPELSLSAYKAAPENLRLMLGRVIVAKPAMPTLEIKPPKAPK